MGAIAFDTLEYVHELKNAGVPEKQAEAQAHALVKVVNENLATKRDIKELETNLKRDIKELELKFEGKFELQKWMMSFILAGIAALMLKAFFMP